MPAYNKQKSFITENGRLGRPRNGVVETKPINKIELNRENLYDSSASINNRDWEQIQSLEDPEDILDINTLQKDFLSKCPTNRPVLRGLGAINKLPYKPYMICEFGMGHTTYELLKWCYQNDGYLVTVEMPIAKKEVLSTEKYLEYYWFGVDRYNCKYEHCMKLKDHLLAKKRWLWINDDCFNVIDQIELNEEYRKKLFLNSQIHYFYEDCIHDKFCHEHFISVLKPYMPSGSIFTGDDDAPTIAF